MKSVYFLKINNGIALIEVLIATVVIATGLLSVASMQGSFIQSSSANKIRAEALTLAEQKIEQSRNNIVLTDYSAIQAGTTTEYPINGINAVFTRILAISNLTSPTRKRIEVTVTWGNTAAEKVVLTSEIAFSDPGNSVGIAAYGTPSGQSPSPNQGSSVDVNDKTVTIYDASRALKSGFQIKAGSSGSSTLFTETATGDTYRLNIGGNTASVVFDCSTLGLTQFDVDLINSLNYESSGLLLSTPVSYLYTRRLNLDGVSGNEAIELLRKNYITTTDSSGVTTNTITPDGTCTREHQFLGGVIISIKGTVYTSSSNLNTIKIDFDKTDMFCAYNPGTDQLARPYACYTGGNCKVSPNGDNAIVNTCPDPSVAGGNVGPGGFSGNVGLINVDDDGTGKESVCFLEELNNGPIATPQVAIIAPQTARKYKTNNNGAEEGINRSYSCQDFYIVDRQPNFSKLSAQCAIKAGQLNLPPKEVIRNIISGDNVVANTVNDLINSNYCTLRTNRTYSLNVNFNPAGTYTVTPGLGGGLCTTLSTSTAYCDITTSGFSVEVFAVSNTTGSKGSTIFNLSPSTLTPATQTITMASPPTYYLSGPLTIPPGTQPYTVNILDSSGNRDRCTTSPPDFPTGAGTSATYNCTIATFDLTVTLKTIKNSNSSIISSCSQDLILNTSNYDKSCGLKTK
jgi:Tfp pilus assembly protein PilV